MKVLFSLFAFSFKGMVIMWGLKPVGAGWAGGSILDPANGKVYKAKMALVDGGKKLNVRGGLVFLCLVVAKLGIDSK